MPKCSVAERSERNPVGPVDAACHICGARELERLCSASEVKAQLRFLEWFHLRRQRRQDRQDLKDRGNFTQDYITDILQCPGCELVCRSPRPPAAAVTNAYVEDDYTRDHLESEFTLQHRWARSKVRSLAIHLHPRLPTTPMVLEVGSFVGGFLAAGQEQGWNMLGVDPGKEVVAFCRGRDYPVFCGTLVDAPVAPASLDAVAIWNTFDQLPNPDSTLAAARRLLHQQGLLVVRVPNGQCFRHLITWGRKLGRPTNTWLDRALAWNNLLGFPYLYGYSLRTLDELLSRHGFARIVVCPDSLMTVSGRESTTWARWEERIVKRCCRIVAHLEQALNRNSCQVAPWLDVYYRVTGRVPDTHLTVSAGISREEDDRRAMPSTGDSLERHG